MRAIRRSLQVVAVVGTLMVGIIALALIVSQTPWFRDWLRRYVVRESKQFVNGDLAIGRMGGNLLFGVNLEDVTVDVSGERVVALESVDVQYNVFTIMSSGLVLDGITIDRPVIRLARDAQGWNLARLVKREQKEADREGPGRSMSIPSIVINGGTVFINDSAPSESYTLPQKLEGLDLKASYEYEPVHYSIVLDHLRFRATSPDLTMEQLSGKIAFRDDTMYLEDVAIKTPGTSLAVAGTLQDYMNTPVLNLTTTGHLSLPEIGRLVPAASGYDLHPRLTVTAAGPVAQLELDLDVQSEAGAVKGKVTADGQSPDLGVRGEVAIAELNLAPILQDPGQRTDLTGQATLDIRMASTPDGASALERMSGTFQFAGPRVVAAGYEARDVRVKGSLDGARINLDGRASAYGGTATAKGFVVTSAPGREVAYDLRGSADGVDLRRLPASTGAPKIETDLSVSAYQVRGEAGTVTGSATLQASTVEGATLADGTVAEFAVSTREISYAARGSVADLNLQRIGTAFDVAAIAKPEYESRFNGAFDVTGSQPRTITPAARRRVAPAEEVSTLSTMTLDASGTLTDSQIMGGRLPELEFEAHLEGGGLKGRTKGTFEGFDPARISGSENLKGTVTGRVDAAFAASDIVGPITPETITADGTVVLTGSTVGGLAIDGAELQGRYASSIGDIAKLTVSGPDVKVEASGRLALDRTSESNLTYHIDVIDLAELARLAGQEGIGGTAILDGTLTGNAAALTTTGTLDGSDLSYEDNKALDANSRYTVTVPDLTFARASVEATTEATFVSAAGLEINALTATTTYADRKIEFTTHIKEQTRELDASGGIVLHADHQEIHMPTLALRTQGVEWRTAPGTDAAIRYGAGQVEITGLRLTSGDQELDVSGTIALAGEPVAGQVAAPATGNLKVVARNVDIQQLETLLLMDRGLTGRLSADATVSGTTASPAIDGHVEIRNGGFETYRYESLVADVEYTGNRVGIDATLQQSAAELITVKGSAPMSLFGAAPGGEHVTAAAGDDVDLTIKSTALGLAVVQGLTTQVTNVSGTLEADLRVTGSGADPHVDGYIDIKNGAFGVPLGGVSYTGLNTRIELDPDTVRLQKFSILDEHGSPLTISGQLAVHERQLGAVNVAIESNDFELIDNELGDVGVESALKLTGELRRPKIVGDIRVERGRLEVDRILSFFYDPYGVEALPDVVSAERGVDATGSAEEATRAALARAGTATAAPVPVKVEAAAPGMMDALELDVQLRIPDNLVLRGRSIRPGGPTGAALGDLNITVGGNINIRKQPGGPILLLGMANTVRGTYEFQGRRFDLVRGGTVRFTGTPDINPRLDISATRTIPNTGVEARVRITGTLQSPELELSSTPPLEDSDILALIVFNRPVNELGSGERSSLAATAGGIATGFIAAPLGESIGRALDLDLFEITTTTDEGDFGAGLTVGQQIGDRAFLKLRQQFGQRSLTEFIIEYQLYDYLRLQVTAAPESSGAANRINQRRVEKAGIDLIFFFSY